MSGETRQKQRGKSHHTHRHSSCGRPADWYCSASCASSPARWRSYSTLSSRAARRSSSCCSCCRCTCTADGGGGGGGGARGGLGAAGRSVCMGRGGSAEQQNASVIRSGGSDVDAVDAAVAVVVVVVVVASDDDTPSRAQSACLHNDLRGALRCFCISAHGHDETKTQLLSSSLLHSCAAA